MMFTSFEYRFFLFIFGIYLKLKYILFTFFCSLFALSFLEGPKVCSFFTSRILSAADGICCQVDKLMAIFCNNKCFAMSF